ncbi:MAG: hypothetical protein M9955_17080 [Rhizobiaceae bacterium]|nr:hypothetical protein [Rhizobiaceae bacterium]
MRRPQNHRWPDRLPLDDDAAIAARLPEKAFAATVAVIRGVSPPMTHEYLICGPRAGTATTDWLRQCVIYMMVGRLGHTLADCSRLMRRDRKSVRYSVYRVLEAVEESPATAQFLDYLEGQLVGELRRMTYDGEI